MFGKAMNGPDMDFWLEAMKSEYDTLESMEKNLERAQRPQKSSGENQVERLELELKWLRIFLKGH